MMKSSLRRRYRWWLSALFGLLLTYPVSAQNYDAVLRGGLIVDGSGAPGFVGDVAIAEGLLRVADPGSIPPQGESIDIDVSGLIVAPGFIDIHTHARADLVSPDSALMLNYLTQGVTSVMIGNDGDGATRVKSRFDRIFDHGAGTNVGQFVGHASLRRRVMDSTDRPATPDEVEAMKALLSQAMSEGALGLSTGLFYAGGAFATTEEVIELARVAKAMGGIYESHIRAESSRGVGVHAAVDEVIEIAEASGVHAHIAHIKVLGKDVWGEAGSIVKKIDAARARGLAITADQYPWVASSTQLKSAVISKALQTGGMEGIRARLASSTERVGMLSDMAMNIERRGGPNSLLLVETEDPKWHGLRLDVIAERLQVSSPEAAARLLEEGRARVVSFNMTEADIETFMRQPWVATSSDGTQGHPRKYGSFPRKYATYVRERGVLSLEQYVRASAGLPAEVLGLSDRGLIADGYKADVLVFDPTIFSEQADFEAWNRLSSGAIHVLVNGVFAIKDGNPLRARAGVALINISVP